MKADALVVAAVQARSALEPAVNRGRLAELFVCDADLVVFPEAFARDFGDPDSELGPDAEALDGAFVSELTRLTEGCDNTVVAGMFETSHDPDRPFNTLVVRGQASADYRKIHLYDSFGYAESDRLLPGATGQAPVFELSGWQVGVMTCYDLRFPEMARQLVDAGAEVIVVPAAWVAGPSKAQHWLTLLAARAIENTVFVVGVGQPGPRYTGYTTVFGPLGEVIVGAGQPAESDEAEDVVTAELRREDLESARRLNPSLKNRRL